MCKIAEKFEMFDAAKARPHLLDFKHNYERVVSGLENCWSLIQDEKSKIGEIQAKLANANAALREAAALGLIFVRPDDSPAIGGGKIRCPHCGASGLQDLFKDHAQMQRHKVCGNPRCRQTFPAANNFPCMAAD